jgi:hypothetical protein
MSLVHGYLLPALGVGSTEVLGGRWWERGGAFRRWRGGKLHFVTVPIQAPATGIPSARETLHCACLAGWVPFQKPPYSDLSG